MVECGKYEEQLLTLFYFASALENKPEAKALTLAPHWGLGPWTYQTGTIFERDPRYHPSELFQGHH